MSTIKDVALLANVGISTVSRVINNSGSVDPETRKIVEIAIKELNYVPNELARSLFRKKSSILGFVVPNISSYFLIQLIESLEKLVSKDDYKLMLFNTRSDDLIEKKCAKFINQYNLDGLILMGFTWNPSTFTNLKTPICTIDHIIDETIPSVSCDNLKGGNLAAQKMISSGAKVIIHFRGPSELHIVQERSKGFKDFVSTHNVILYEYDLDLINPCEETIKEVIKKHSDADSIFCASDIMAIHTLRILHNLKINIPKDMQVIGFDNIKLSRLINPSLTTIEQPIDKIAQAAFSTILDQIYNRKIEIMHKVIPIKLIERESTR